MKKITLLTAVATAIVLAFLSSSCVESSSKYKTLLSQRDSIQLRNNSLNAEYNETLDILNEIESGFQAIRESEGKMLVEMQNAETQTTSKKERLMAEVANIKEILVQNKARIQQLQNKLNQTDKTLSATIERLQGELNEKTLIVEAMQEELSKKNIHIEMLVAKVDTLNAGISDLNKMAAQQKTVIESQDTGLNTVWYCLATEKELKAAEVLTGGGWFRSKDVMKKDFNKNIFTKTDLRQLSSIALNSKSAKIYSSHPEGSYTLVEGDGKMLTLQINNPEKFWGVSKYLVVSVKK